MLRLEDLRAGDQLRAVSLTYTVKLTNPDENTPGTHGQYDGNGTKGYDSLFTNKEATLYPVDSNGEKGWPENFRKPTVEYTPDTVTVWPADMTIYMGGTQGYEGVVEGSGGSIVQENTNSLPEPGFYIDLGDDLNKKLKAEYPDYTTATDLTELISFSQAGDETRGWEFQKYGATNSEAYDKFVYRLVPTGTDQDPVRLEFKSGDQYFTSDDFTPTQSLSNEYEMGIYAGGVDLANIVMTIQIGDETYTRAVKVDIGKLTVRYVVDSNEGNPVTGVVSNIADAGENAGKDAYAVISDDAKYYINKSDIDTTDEAAPSLLFDSIVTTETGNEDETAFDDALLEKATDVIGSNFKVDGHESKYLDLVDANNGNAWLTTDSDVTIYWPYPENTSSSTNFRLVHVQGLDRDMTVGENNQGIFDEIEEAPAENIEVENTEHGVKFTLKADENGRVAFSPFVLMWGTTGGTIIPGDDEGDLTISKEITGNLASADDVFTFTVTVEGVDGTVSTSAGDIEFNNGTATITLMGGQSITIYDLPEGAEYAVVETDANGYKLVSAVGDEGEITAGTVKASFTNDKSETVDPDDPDDPDTPDEPDDPDTPDEPDEPDTPDTPDDPDEPDTPDTPDTPDEPDQPSDPGKPSKPSQPSKPSEPVRPNVPDTGDHTNAALPVLLALGGAALVGGALWVKVRKDH